MTQLRYAIEDWRQLPAGYAWLNATERARLDEFRFEKRRRDWLLGRWAAKLALLRAVGLPERDLGRVGIGTAADGAPMPTLDGRPCRTRLSLSHSHGRAFSVASTDAGALGCDMEFIEPRGPEFVETWFTESERERAMRAAPEYLDSLVTMVWSAKEATLKALRTGLRIDTRCVEVIDGSNGSFRGWNTARTSVTDRGEFDCLWRLDGRFVLTVAYSSL